MTLNSILQKDSRLRLLVEGARVLLFLVILLVIVVSDLIQSAFINWGMLGPFYGFVLAAMSMHLLVVWKLDEIFTKPRWLFLTFAFDAVLISGLIFYSGLNQSLFLFLHLVNILLAGLVFRTEGGLIIALVTGVLFTGVGLLGPDLKVIQFVFLLILNNLAFFLVAGLAGYMSDQLQSVGLELRRTGLSLKAARELNQLVVENIPSGLVSFSASGEILQANAAAHRILETDSLESRNVYDLLSGFEPREVGETSRFDLKFQPPGMPAKILGVVASSFESPELGGAVRVALVEDLTKVRSLEGSLRQAEKMAAVGQLAAGIAHEIRNPLSGISGSIELLSQTTVNEDDQKLMKIILREIDRLNHLITEFLEYSRPEPPPTDPVDLASVLTDVLSNALAGKTLSREVEVIRELQSGVSIAGRNEKLKQAFLNIMINALQAMESTLRPVLEVKLTTAPGEVIVQIRDNGSGMSEATRKRMFEPFHTTKSKGTGLGLAVTHKILEGHGARIFVESEEGRGTEFKLVFPAYELRT